jgi:hypothetical protein
MKSKSFLNIVGRCFEHEPSTLNSALNIIKGIDTHNDIAILTRYHWWNDKNRDFISTLLKSYILSLVNNNILVTKNKLLVTDTENNNFRNSAYVLLEGFRNMKASDLKCIGNTDKSVTPIENALSGCWALSASENVDNVFLHPQIRSPVSGFADYFINSHCNCIFEFIKDGTTAHCDEHLNRFLSGQYPWKQFLIVNLVMKENVKQNPLALPTNAAYHNIFFTYVYSENTLYCGKTRISSPAIECFRSSSKINNALPTSDFYIPK